MIQSELLEIKGRKLIRYWSDEGFMISRDGQLFSEAVDPVGMQRKYVETDIPIEPLEEGEDA